jgi:DNA helicase-2/ATP-dependent DNA helicase PcrA
MTHDLKLNDAQRRAVEFPIDHPLKIVAGAGTGKTAVLTERFVHIVERHHIRPSRILALTFTKKAAAEMEQRIIRKLLRRGLMNRSEAPLLLWIGNFHSICLALLRQHALVAGLDPSFGTIDDTEQRLLLADVIADFLNQRLNLSDSKRFEALMIDRIDDFSRNAAGVVNRLRSYYLELDNVRDMLIDTLEGKYLAVKRELIDAADDTSLRKTERRKAKESLELLPVSKAHEMLLADAVSAICTAYARKLGEQDILDFNDLIAYTCRLADNEPLLKDRFDYLLVDEFQDTDGAQYQLLEALSDSMKNVTVVCDKKQSIYEWREARIENIETFPGEPIFLDENYRSFGEILDSANDFIARTMGDEKALRPAHAGGRGRAEEPRVRLYRAANNEEEADYVASEIHRLLEQYGADKIAILMRSVRASGAIEDALRSRGIPYSTVGGRGFYDISESKDLVALLRLIENPFDDFSMARVLKSAVIGLADATLYELRGPGKKPTKSFYDALRHFDEILLGVHPLVRARLQALGETINELSDRKWSMTIGETVSELILRTNYLKYLACIEGTRGPGFTNVSRFYKTATLFEERNPGAGLGEFLAYMEMSMAGNVGPANAQSPKGAIQIMTVHQAKGLEFPVVFVVNLRKGAFPLTYKAGGFGHDERFGLYAVKLPDGKHSVRYKTGIFEILKDRQNHEENRIMYVAMTRAEELLYLTTPQSHNDNDFFGGIEEFVASTGTGSAEIVNSYESSERVAALQVEEGRNLSEDEIMQAAEQAVARIQRRPKETTAGEANLITLSYSRLSLFRHCRAKYALRYVYNLPLAPHEESREEDYRHIDAFTLGNLLHDVLMHFHRRRRIGTAADAFEILDSLSASISQALVKTAKKMLDVYMRHSLSRTETLREEEEFHWKSADDAFEIMFEGKIDRIHREGETLKIVDYKTGEDHGESHGLQLGIYRLAMEEVLGEHDILTSNFYLSTGEEVVRSFSPDDLHKIRRHLLEDARKIASGDFRISTTDRRNASYCGGCGYGTFCKEKAGRCES